MNIKKILGIVVGVALVGWILYGNVKQQETQSNEKRTVYAVLPLSGAIANSGQEYKKAFELYTEENPDIPFQFVYIDGQFQPTQSLTALQSKILDEKSPIVITVGTTIGSAIVPFVEKQNGFTFISGGTKANLLDDYNNFLVLSSLNGKGMENIATYISKQAKDAVMLYSNSDYGVLNEKILRQSLNDKVNLYSEAFDTNNSDIRILVLKVLEKNPDAIVVSGPAVPAFINLFNEIKAQGYKGKLIADITFNQPVVIRNLGKNAENIIFLGLDSFLEYPNSNGAKKFKALFKKHNIEASTAHLEGYNVALLIDKGLRDNLQFNQTSFQKLKQFEGGSGNVEFNEKGNAKFSYILTTIKNGKIVPVEE